MTGTNLGLTYYYARRPDEAIVQFQKALELNPNFALARRGLAAVHEKKGEAQAALEEYRKLISLDPGKPSPFLAHLEIVSGKTGEARKTLERLKERSRHEYVDPLGVAQIYTGLGDKDAAFEWLQRAYENHSPSLIWVKVDPIYDSLRSDPRFQDLLRRMNFPP